VKQQVPGPVLAHTLWQQRSRAHGDSPQASQHALRTLACRVTERHQHPLNLLGVAGVIGFVVSRVCLCCGLCDTRAYLLVASVSLVVLFGSLGITLLGDRYELSRLLARSQGRELRDSHVAKSDHERRVIWVAGRKHLTPTRASCQPPLPFATNRDDSWQYRHDGISRSVRR
jgi:hypothetical protein